MGEDLIKSERLQSGPANIKFGPLNTVWSATNLPYSVGLTEGTVSCKLNRTTLVKEAGNPEMEVKRQVTKETLTVDFTCSEFEKDKLKRYTGAGEQTTVAAAAAYAIASEAIYLEGTAWHQLRHHHLTSTQVDNGAATPVPWNATTDYELDATVGKIRRRTGSTIPDGTIVYFTGTANKPKIEQTTWGGDSSTVYFGMTVIFTKDNTYHETWDCYKMCPEGNFERNFNKTGTWNEYKITLHGQRDSTRTSKDQLCRVWDEVETEA